MPLRSLLKMKIPWEENHCVWMNADGAYGLYDLRTQWDFGLEGYLLAHCIGTKDADEFNEAHRLFSLRDKLGVTHCTVLLQRDDTWSPYGHSGDMLSREPMTFQGDKYFVLQVRGRKDALARWEYYKLVREWYLANGGEQRVPFKYVRKAVKNRQDTDLKYHYGYLLDESANYFNWAYHNEEVRERARKLGLSL